MAAAVRVVGSRYSAESQRVREFLARSRVPHEWLDPDSEPQVESLLRTERAARGLDEPTSADAGDGATVGELVVDPHALHAARKIGATRKVAARKSPVKKHALRAAQLLITVGILAWIFHDPKMRADLPDALRRADRSTSEF